MCGREEAIQNGGVSLAESSDKTVSKIAERLANNCHKMTHKEQGATWSPRHMFPVWKKSRGASRRRRHSRWRIKTDEEQEKGAPPCVVLEATHRDRKRALRFLTMLGDGLTVLRKRTGGSTVLEG